MNDETTILQFGQPDTTRFLLRDIRIGDRYWPMDERFIDPLIVPNGYELVIRQDGHAVRVMRRLVQVQAHAHD